MTERDGNNNRTRSPIWRFGFSHPICNTRIFGGFSMHRIALAAFTILALTGAVQAASFDGHWSVLIITDRGDCDRAYRYEVQIGQGRMVNAAPGGVDLAGSVSPNGTVRVRVSKGSQFAEGGGRLSARSGRGTWRGRASAGSCSGRWEAERR